MFLKKSFRLNRTHENKGSGRDCLTKLSYSLTTLFIPLLSINPYSISQPRLMMPPNPIEFILLRAVLTRPGPIYFSPFQCTFKFHVNSISLLLGRKQLWLIPSSSWRCPLSQWAKRHVCVWGDWKRGGGSSECCTHRGHSVHIHIRLLHIGSMWTKGVGWCVQNCRVIKYRFFPYLHTFSGTFWFNRHHASMGTDGLWSFNEVRNYNLYAND